MENEENLHLTKTEFKILKLLLWYEKIYKKKLQPGTTIDILKQFFGRNWKDNDFKAIKKFIELGGLRFAGFVTKQNKRYRIYKRDMEQLVKIYKMTDEYKLAEDIIFKENIVFGL